MKTTVLWFLGIVVLWLLGGIVKDIALSKQQVPVVLTFIYEHSMQICHACVHSPLPIKENKKGANFLKT